MAVTGVARWVPGVRVVREYRRAWLWPDVRAGIVVTALMIPAGMGYAQVAGLPPVTGLYASIVPLLAYAVFGPSRILVLAPDSALAPIIAAAILPLAVGSESRAVALAGLLAIMVGALMLLGGVLRLGFVTDLLSKPVRIGYLNAIAVIVIVSQVPKLLGFSVESDGPWQGFVGAWSGIVEGRVLPTAAVIGLGSLAVIVVLRRLRSRVPGVLVAVVVAVVTVWLAGLQDRLPVVGSLPQGLPAPALGGVTWADAGELLAAAAAIALVSFTDSAVLSRTLAARRGETVSGSAELRGIGAANVATGLLGGFPVSASSSRTPVAQDAGARTQLTGVVSAILVALFMLLVPDLTRYLPQAALAAVVIGAALTLIDAPGLMTLWRRNRVDAGLSMLALVGVLVFGVLEGIVVAIALSLLTFVNRSWRPYRTKLGRIPGRRGYHDVSRHPEHAAFVDGVVLLRFDAPLFFANGSIFDDWVREMVDDAGSEIHTVILAAEPVTGIDTTAFDELVELDDYLSANGIRLVFAEMKGPVKDVLRRYGSEDRFTPDRFYPTVGAAVDEVTGTRRDDLEDGAAG
ncbi:SulP family inorganic anion transporter [Demequina zhanjiangensis]|uniref:SulP family inorganic anion transporter n=1 Tax=Demequina zhanjiangensis TaxID=3051659 RepID=A0ABT8G3X8_9MICO|nr:SulP family inorganic anion transporter [Demequina sp. SYSU T00b26]MDN4473835.1 SulP family inorganic anion transporter [Demequina sp. SYSU T00b26]